MPFGSIFSSRRKKEQKFQTTESLSDEKNDDLKEKHQQATKLTFHAQVRCCTILVFIL